MPNASSLQKKIEPNQNIRLSNVNETDGMQITSKIRERRRGGSQNTTVRFRLAKKHRRQGLLPRPSGLRYAPKLERKPVVFVIVYILLDTFRHFFFYQKRTSHENDFHYSKTACHRIPRKTWQYEYFRKHGAWQKHVTSLSHLATQKSYNLVENFPRGALITDANVCTSKKSMTDRERQSKRF